MNQQQRYDIFKRHAKNFVLAPKSGRPLLEGIHYDGMGRGIATDGAILLLVEDVQRFATPVTLHAKTGDVIPREFPAVDRVIPTSFALTVRLAEIPALLGAARQRHLNEIARLHEVAVGVSSLYEDEYHYVNYQIGGGEFRVTASHKDTSFSSLLSAYHVPTDAELGIYFNAERMANAIRAIAAFQPAVVTMNFGGSLSPCVLLTDVGVTVVIAPLRGKKESIDNG